MLTILYILCFRTEWNILQRNVKAAVYGISAVRSHLPNYQTPVITYLKTSEYKAPATATGGPKEPEPKQPEPKEHRTERHRGEYVCQSTYQFIVPSNSFKFGALIKIPFPMFTCPECDCSFSSERDYVCVHCEKSLPSSESLT